MSATAVIQTAFIGDVVLATPLYTAARLNRPGVPVVAVVRSDCANLVENNPDIDDLVIWDKHGKDRGMRGILRITRELRARRADIALIPHRSIRSALMAALAGIPVRAGFAKGGGGLLHTIRVPYRTGIHEVERNLSLGETLGWRTDGLTPAIYPDDRDRATVSRITTGMGRFCVLAPGSVWATKRWPTASYVETGQAFSGHGYGVVISGGPSDRAVCMEVSAGIPGAVDTCGVLTLRQSAELYRRAEFVLTGDTAPQHIAAAMGTRVFALFGPTVRDFGFWPYTDRGVVIEEGVACRPCGAHGPNRCPRGTHECLERITSDRVTGIVDHYLALPSDQPDIADGHS